MISHYLVPTPVGSSGSNYHPVDTINIYIYIYIYTYIHKELEYGSVNFAHT